jgi:hypothetical protein
VFTGDGTIETEREAYERQESIVTTSNKQLNFLQHIMWILAEDRPASVILTRATSNLLRLATTRSAVAVASRRGRNWRHGRSWQAT